nr:glycerol-3-phosphate dehydrogenase, mitochondrial-like [Drosophila bipectinata]
MFAKLSCPIRSSPHPRRNSQQKVHSRAEDHHHLATRRRQIESLDSTIFDVLVIGGGATGCGCALDAASRGLKVALIEASDFGSGTSAKSSKLVHGGLRRLPMAINTLDTRKIGEMRDTLMERGLFLRNAPHLVSSVPMLMPLQSYAEMSRVWLILKLYDLLAGFSRVQSSHFLSPEETHLACPLLKMDRLRGALVSYELQMDDARLCMALAMTAARQGARIVNYVQAQQLSGPDQEGIRSCLARDLLSRRQILVRSNSVVNATGPYVDGVRRLDSEQAVAVAKPAAGTHIVLPGYFSRSHAIHSLGHDELFAMPWQGHTLVGCTSGPPGLAPTREEVEVLLEKFRAKLRPDVELNTRHVLSAWKGLWTTICLPDRPLVSETGLITISGGNWTNYRAMAEAAVEAAVRHFQLPVLCPCRTRNIPLDGSVGYTAQLATDLVQCFGVTYDVANHLVHSYGCNAFRLLTAFDTAHQKLHPQFPHIEAEVHYAVEYEFALTAFDVLARRMRVAFLDVAAATHMLPRVVEIMAQRLKWSKPVQDAEMQRTIKFLQQEMGMGFVTVVDTIDASQELEVRKSASK